MEESKINFTDSLNSALQGSMDAFDFLYRKSYPVFEKQVYEYCSNPADVEDILQEAYIKIFENLGSLKNANNFISWGRQICRNEAINFGKKKQAKKNDYVSMPETSDDEDVMGMDEIPASTYSADINPEAKIDASETKRLMDDMLGELTENQRLVISMWQEQFSFSEIAQELGMPINTVKSHFNRGKKALEAKVKDLEKKGTKLYGMAPLPFFLWVMHQFDQLYVPDISPEHTGPLFEKIIEQLPEHAIDLSKSTPKIIEKYGTDAMKQEEGRLHLRRDTRGNGPDTAQADNRRPNYQSSDGGYTDSGVEDSTGGLHGESSGSINNSDRVSTSQQNGTRNYSSSQNAAQDTTPGRGTAVAAGNGAAGTAATGTSIAARVSIIAVIVIIGIGGFAGFRLLRNNDNTEPDQTEESDSSTNEQQIEDEDQSGAGPVFTQEEAAGKTSQEIAEALGLEYIGNSLTMQDTEISDIPSGCVSSYVHDFDGDGDNEILTVEIETQDGTAHVIVFMYEFDGDQWARASGKTKEISNWDSLKSKTDSYGNLNGEQEVYCHVVGDEIYVSDADLIYDSDSTVVTMTYDGNSFQDGEIIDCSKQTIFDNGGICLAGLRFSYYSTDFTYGAWTHGFEESYAMDFIDFTDMPTYTIGNYEFSYPKYFDNVGIQMVPSETWTGKNAVTITLVDDRIKLPSYDRDMYAEGTLPVNYWYSGTYSSGDLWDAVVFWESGDTYWAYEEGDGWAVNLDIADNSNAFSLFHLYNIAYKDSEQSFYYFHSLG